LRYWARELLASSTITYTSKDAIDAVLSLFCSANATDFSVSLKLICAKFDPSSSFTLCFAFNLPSSLSENTYRFDPISRSPGNFEEDISDAENHFSWPEAILSVGEAQNGFSEP
jgi:hypothetical protein